MNDNWEGWAALQGLLQDGQVWENKEMVFQIDKVGDDNYRVVMFTSKNEELHYVGIVLYDAADKLCQFLDSMGMTPTSKFLTIRRD